MAFILLKKKKSAGIGLRSLKSYVLQLKLNNWLKWLIIKNKKILFLIRIILAVNKK